MGAQRQEFYSEDEAEQILKLAVKKTSATGVTRENLLQSAAELGISPEALLEAERNVLERRAEQEDLAAFDAYQKREYYEHLSAYLSISAVLVGIDLWTHQFWANGIHPTWSIGVVVIWGIFMLFGAFGTFVKTSGGYREEFEQWRRRRDKKARKAAKAQSATTDPLLDRLMLEEPSSKIELIGRLRQETNMDLCEAKETVEDYVSRHPGVLA